MENLSFEPSPTNSAANDPVDNPLGQSNPDPPGKEQKNANIPPLARITDDEDNESPPAHVQRYMPKKQNIQDDLDLEQPPADPGAEPHVDRSDPELKATQRKREQYRKDQLAKEGPSRLRPDSPQVQPLPAPQQYHDDPIGQHEANADSPEQQEVVAGQDVDNVPVPGQQGVAEPDPADPGQQADNAPLVTRTWRETYVSCCERMQSFHFQFAFHTLVLILALATGALGAMNWGNCQMNIPLPYVMLVLSGFATATIVNRLLAMYYEQQFPDFSIACWWISVRVMEVLTWIGFCSQLGLFFMQTPSFNPSETPYCLPRLYRINCAFMFVTSALMVLWTVVNVQNLIGWSIMAVRRRNENRNA